MQWLGFRSSDHSPRDWDPLVFGLMLRSSTADWLARCISPGIRAGWGSRFETLIEHWPKHLIIDSHGSNSRQWRGSHDRASLSSTALGGILPFGSPGPRWSYDADAAATGRRRSPDPTGRRPHDVRRRAHLRRLSPDGPRRAGQRRGCEEAPGGDDPRVGALGGPHRLGTVQRLLLWRGDLAPGVPRTASAPARYATHPAGAPPGGQRLLGPCGAERVSQHLVRAHGRRLAPPGARLRPTDAPVIPSRPSRPAGIRADCS